MSVIQLLFLKYCGLTFMLRLRFAKRFFICILSFALESRVGVVVVKKGVLCKNRPSSVNVILKTHLVNLAKLSVGNYLFFDT